jgi:broad specificity phosphatase PhoE
MRTGGFPGPDTPLDDAGRRKAAGLRVPAADRFRVAPERAALDTAEAMQLAAVTEASLRDLDFGRWTGRDFAELMAEAPEAFARWMGDPASATPEGEPLSASIARADDWLRTLEKSDDTLCAIAGPSFIRSALAAAIGLPPASALRIDIAPLSATTLSFNRLWRLQAIEPA